jgi:hypothetical protein
MKGNKIKGMVSGSITSLFNEIVYTKIDYTNSIKFILNKIGDEKITNVKIRRAPIDYLTKMVNTFNNINYDEYYHLDMIIMLNM